MKTILFQNAFSVAFVCLSMRIVRDVLRLRCDQRLGNTTACNNGATTSAVTFGERDSPNQQVKKEDEILFVNRVTYDPRGGFVRR